MVSKWNSFHEHVYKFHHSKIVELFTEINSQWDSKKWEPYEDNWDNLPDGPQPWEKDDFEFFCEWEDDAEKAYVCENEPEPPNQDDFPFAEGWSKDKWNCFIAFIVVENYKHNYKDKLGEVFAEIAEKWEGPGTCGLCPCDKRKTDGDGEEAKNDQQSTKKARSKPKCGKCSCAELDYEGPCTCGKYSHLCEDCGSWGHDGSWYCGGDDCSPISTSEI